MKTFLDTNIAKTKSFILYGNLKDVIWCPDLMPRDLEHYLVKLLKSRGYEHIIFYGEAGTKGAYCLDEKSACFFFPAEEGNESIRYSHRGQSMRDFLKHIHPLMLDRESHMAVVFYNMLTTDMKNCDLRDDILDVWEKNSRGNICLMLVPETMNNQSALETRIRQYGLESKFMQQISNSSQSIPNAVSCLKIGQPNVDEIGYMFRYLSMAGTEQGNTITFRYSKLEQLAQRVQYASGKRAGQSELSAELASEYMTEMYSTLSAYIDAKAQADEVLELTIADIDQAWGIASEEGKALQELQKPGWEPAYEKVTEALKIAQKARERAQKLAGEGRPLTRPSADWGVQRVETVREDCSSSRQPIPNFVLLGNPGTGKSTIARLIGRILHEAGLLKIGQTIEVTKENLTSSYIAGVPKATMSKAHAAEEGVLFIDEAHLLGKKDGGAGHEGTGVEVISTLNAVMTSQNHHLSIILAGYEDEMEAVFELDPGFKSRFGNNFIYLKDYSPELLTEILRKALTSKGYALSGDLTEEQCIGDTVFVPLQCMVERLYSERDRKRFGNARDIMNLAAAAEGKCTEDLITRECFYGGLNGKINQEWFSPMDIGASVKYVLEEMDRKFVGMEKAKTAMRNIGLELEDYAARGISHEKAALRPIILVGNPGVGKSSLANLLPKLYFHYQLLGTARPIVVHASSLADKYQGGSQEKVLEYIKKAQDAKAFLFVDEAHELLNEHFDGRGAFKAFMAPTTDAEHPFLACFAVYPSKLKEFLKIDPGAERRFRIIHLEDYNAEELFTIMQRMIAEKGYRTTKETEELLRRVMEQVYATRTDSTGNAGKVANILEDMDMLRRQRCAEAEIPFDSEDSLIFVPEDIPESLREGARVSKQMSRVERLEQILESFESRMSEERVAAENLQEILLEKLNSLIYQEKFSRRAKKATEPGHYFFKGNPGTGKTTGAAFFAKYLYELGLVQSPKPVYVSASALVGQYLGETGVKTRDRLLDSVGRVLMIDEAYALAEPNSSANSYKRDAVNEIVNFLDHESYRKTTCVIFSGYEHDMDELYRMNDGLKSRIKEVYFEDFTLEQSMEILKSVLRADEISLSGEAEAICAEQLEQMRECTEYANGRTIRRYSELLCSMLEQRCIQNAAEYSEDDPRAYEIQVEDVPELPTVLEKLNICD